MRWAWSEGPTKGKVHEHVFHDDGTVEWREVGGAAPKKAGGEDSASPAAPERVPYAAFDMAPEIYAVSYLAKSGFTLTVVVNLATKQLVGFASNDEAWFPVRGTCERAS